MTARRLLDERGALIGLAARGARSSACSSARSSSRAGEPRADGAPDGDRLRRRARHDDGDRRRAASICRSDRSSRSARSSIALLLRADVEPAARRARRASPPARSAASINGLLITRLARRAVHRHARHDAARARRGEGAGRRAAHRGADHLAERPAADRAATAAGCSLPAGIWMTRRAGRSSSRRRCGYTRFGRHLFAIGSNERTARLCGVRVDADARSPSTRSSAALAGARRRAAVLEAVGRRSDGRASASSST